MQTILSLLIVLFLVGCNGITRQKQSDIVIDTPKQKITKRDSSLTEIVTTNDEKALSRKEKEERDKHDSLNLIKILNTVLRQAEGYKAKTFYRNEYEVYPDDTSFIVSVKTEFGYLFSNNRKHLVIRRKILWAVFCDVYLLDNNQFKKVIGKEQSEMTYQDDTLKDVNGDNYKDFLIHSYPSSGCCLADICDAYLYQPQTGNFTHNYEFINPTFFPKEKIIRGLEYGHPGEAGLYKYKWNGLHIDTIEFIYPCYNQKGKFVKAKTQQYRPTEQEGVLLTDLPAEYKQLNTSVLNWFFDKY